MDIQVSSNHERLLFELSGRDGARTAELLDRFRGLGAVEAPHNDRFQAAALDDAETLAVIRDVHDATGVLVDPHTAVGIGAARACRSGDVADGRAGHRPPGQVPRRRGAGHRRPARASRPAWPDLLDRPERFEVLPADVEAIRAHVLAAVA